MFVAIVRCENVCRGTQRDGNGKGRGLCRFAMVLIKLLQRIR